MPITLKKDEWKVRDPSSGNYRGVAILSTTLPEDATQIIEDTQNALDAEEVRAGQIINNAQNAVDGIEGQSTIILESIAKAIQDGNNYELIDSAVESWLNTHPEATTTVQDKSLTWEKFVNGAIGYVTPEDFGAVGDYVTDDSEAFQQAFSSGFPVYIDGTYVVNNVVCNNSLTAFFSEKTRIKRTQTKSINQSGIFEFYGEITNTTPLTIDCNEESTQITVEDSSNFNIGDMIVLSNQNDTYSNNFILTTMITAIDGNQISLKDKVQHNFLLSDNPIIQQIEPITVNLYGEGATFDGNGLIGRGYCIFMKYNINSSINNFNVTNNSTGISRLDECYNCYIFGCNGENPTSIEPPYGEFLNIAYSTHVIANKINTTNYRPRRSDG